MMAAIEIMRYLLIWGTIGAVLFSFFVIFVFRSGIAYTARNEDGLLKEIIPWLATWHRVDSLFWSFNSWSQQIISGFTRSAIKINFGGLYALNLFLYLILFLFDTLVIDGFVIGYWRPAFLRLPQRWALNRCRNTLRNQFRLVLCSAWSFPCCAPRYLIILCINKSKSKGNWWCKEKRWRKGAATTSTMKVSHDETGCFAPNKD